MKPAALAPQLSRRPADTPHPALTGHLLPQGEKEDAVTAGLIGRSGYMDKP